MKETLHRRQLLQGFGALGLAALTKAAFPSALYAENTPQPTSKELFNSLNKKLQAQVPYRSISPLTNEAGEPNYDTTLESIRMWEQVEPIIESENSQEVTVPQTTFLTWTNTVGPFYKLTSTHTVDSFPAYTENTTQFAYAKEESEEGSDYTLIINNEPVDQLEPYQGSLKEASMQIWTEEKLKQRIPSETRELMDACKANPSSHVSVITADSLFNTAEATIYEKAKGNPILETQVADTVVYTNQNHNILTMAALAHLVPEDTELLQMFAGSLRDYFAERLLQIEQNRDVSPAVVYLPYPVEYYPVSTSSSFFNKLEEMKVIIIYSSGNGANDSTLNTPIIPGILCATSMTGSMANPNLINNRSPVPEEVANQRVYAMPERLPSMFVKPELHHSDEGLSLWWQTDSTETAGSSYANLFLVAVVKRIMEELITQGEKFSIARVEERLQEVTTEHFVEKNNKKYPFRSINLPLFLQKYGTPVEPEPEPLPQEPQQKYELNLPYLSTPQKQPAEVSIAAAPPLDDSSFAMEEERKLHENIEIMLVN